MPLLARQKLLVVTTSYPLTKDGTSGIFVKRLNDTLAKYFEIKVICPSSDEISEVDVIDVRYGPRKWQILAQKPGGIPVALKKNKMYVILLPAFLVSMFLSVIVNLKAAEFVISHWSANGLITGLANLLFRRESVVVFHGSDAINLSKLSFMRLSAWMAIKLNKNCVCVSKDITSNLKTTFPKLQNKIHFIPNGVDSVFLDAKPKYENDQVDCLTVANLNPLKGIADIIRSFEKISNKMVKLNIVGDGPIRGDLEKLVDNLGLQNRVSFLGVLAPHQVSTIMKNNQVFILASYREGRSSVVLEALASGMAVIATDLPGTKELIDNGVNGLLFPVGDIRKLSQHIENVTTNDVARRKLAATGRQSVIENNLTWEDTAKGYINLMGGKAA